MRHKPSGLEWLPLINRLAPTEDTVVVASQIPGGHSLTVTPGLKIRITYRVAGSQLDRNWRSYAFAARLHGDPAALRRVAVVTVRMRDAFGIWFTLGRRTADQELVSATVDLGHDSAYIGVAGISTARSVTWSTRFDPRVVDAWPLRAAVELISPAERIELPISAEMPTDM